jgi:hypothetical protein
MPNSKWSSNDLSLMASAALCYLASMSWLSLLATRQWQPSISRKENGEINVYCGFERVKGHVTAIKEPL